MFAKRSLSGRIGSKLAKLAIILVLTISVALVALFSFEQFTLRPLAEYLVESNTGRKFSIEGELDASAGRIIKLSAGGISLANADWGSRENLLSIDSAEISIDLTNLLGGVVAIDDLEVSGVEILFEQDEQGLSNWAMGLKNNASAPDSSSPDEDASKDENTASTNEAAETIVFPVIQSRLSNIDITLQGPTLPQPIKVQLDSVEHSAAQGNEVRASIVGAIQNRPVNLQASIGPLSQLLDAGAVDFAIKGEFEAGVVEADGRLEPLGQPEKVTLQLSLLAPDIAQIFAAFGQPALVSGATEVRISMQPAGDHLELDLAASLDLLKLEAKARLQALDSIDGASASLSAGGQDLAAIGNLAGLQGLPSQPFELKSSLTLSGKLLTIGETRFDSGDNHLTAEGSMSQFPRLDGSNVKLQLLGKNYLDFAELAGIEDAASFQPEPFEVNANLNYSAQGQQQFTAELAIADVSGDFSGAVTGDPAYTGSHLKFRLDGQNNALIQRLLGRPISIEGNYSLQGNAQRTATGIGIDAATLSVGANEIQVSGSIGNQPLLGDSELNLQFVGPDLSKIAAIAGYSGFFPAGTAEISTSARAENEVVHLDKLSAAVGRNQLKASGQISIGDVLNGSRLEVAFAAQDIVEVLPPELHSYVDAQQAFELTGTLATKNAQIAIETLQAKLGDTVLKTSGTVSPSDPMTATALKLDLQGPDLAEIIPEELQPFNLPAEKFSVVGNLALGAEGMTLEAVETHIGEDQIVLSGTIPLENPVEGLNLSVSASGPNLDKVIPVENDQIDFADLAYEIAANIQLADGVASLRQLHFSTPRGEITGGLSISLEDPLQFGNFDLDAKGDNLAEFAPTMPAYSPPEVAFELHANGNWDSEKVRIEEGILKLDDSKLEAKGEINLHSADITTHLALSAQGNNLADFGQLRDLVLPSDAFRVEASVQANAEGIQIPELKARVGNSDLHGSIQIDFSDKPDIEIDLESKLLNLAKLLPEKDSSAETEESSQPEPADGRLIPDLPVQADRLNEANLKATIKVGELRLAHSTLRNIEIDMNLLDGALEVGKFSATATRGTINASFLAVADGERISTRGNLEGTNIVLGKKGDEDKEASNPEMDLALKFDTAGATVREMAANLNGYAQLSGGKGRLENNLALGLFGSFFTELFSAVNPFATREPYTTISCFTAYAEINDGVSEIKPGAVLQTDKLNMFAIGQVDLKTEQVGLRFETSPRTGIGVSVGDFINPFVGVSGTLANPGLGVDPENAMFEGGFAVATGGLSIVAKSLFNRWFSDDDPCAKIEQKAQKYLAEKEAADQQEAQEAQEALSE